ncbi:NAD-dependent deacylase [Apibacter raozihei]|uniref:SIR2 family NAD-dependent protein deacylase n=1 Tax=Apibacter raozihei TaxID=2500547 RepID=UPI000FE2E9EE|nr:NAD-dependent deacylase [Apibacter raozihei]
MKKKLVVLTGAGISAESGLSTFRDSGGLWEKYDISEVASIKGWFKNPKLVLDFYNMRRSELKDHQPNQAHYLLKELESEYNVYIITQNVDNFHERAGSTNILHLHGELNKVRSETNESLVYETLEEIQLGQLAEDGGQLRPDIVWFGEAVPKMEEAIQIAQTADIFMVIGTSLQVYPAASLLDYVPASAPIYVIDPNSFDSPLGREVTFIQEPATKGLQSVKSLMV